MIQLDLELKKIIKENNLPPEVINPILEKIVIAMYQHRAYQSKEYGVSKEGSEYNAFGQIIALLNHVLGYDTPYPYD